MKLALCQTPVSASLAENQTMMKHYVNQAAKSGAQLVCLPEMWACPYDNSAFPKYAEPEGGETWRCLRDAARENHVWLVGGSVPERDGERLYNTCYVFSPEGSRRQSTAKCICSISTSLAASASWSRTRSRPASP